MGMKAIPVEMINKRLPKESLLTAIEYLSESHVSAGGSRRRMVKCKCSCGNECNCIVADLLRGNPLSCGCKKRGRKSIHKIGDSILYKRWQDMRLRCYDPKNCNYKNYGAKGVLVCNEWLNDYEAFAVWSLNNGYSPELQLDKDIKGDGKLYSPETCTWTEAINHASFKSTSVKYEFRGQMLTIPDISRMTGVLQSRLKSSIKAGKTIEEAVSQKPKKPKFKIFSNKLPLNGK